MAFSVEKRLAPSKRWMYFSIAIALASSVLASAFLIWTTGAVVSDAFVALFDGAFGSKRAIGRTLARSIPLILTGIAVTVAFRAKIWNIGAEGQLFAGAIMGYWVYVLVGPGPGIFILPLVFVAGFAGGALYGGFAGYLRARFAVNEVLTTVMLNYIVLFFLSYLLVSGPWRDQATFYAQTPRLDRAVWLPKMFNLSKLNIGFAVAVVLAFVVHFMLSRTSFGFEVKAVGLNARAAMFKGINIKRTTVMVMMISGGLAGLAGVIEVFGTAHRLSSQISHGYGFTGIIIAVLAMLNPLAVVVVAIVFGAFSVGGVTMQVTTGVPSAIISAIEAITLLFFLASTTLARFQIVWVKKK